MARQSASSLPVREREREQPHGGAQTGRGPSEDPAAPGFLANPGRVACTELFAGHRTRSQRALRSRRSDRGSGAGFHACAWPARESAGRRCHSPGAAARLPSAVGGSKGRILAHQKDQHDLINRCCATHADVLCAGSGARLMGCGAVKLRRCRRRRSSTLPVVVLPLLSKSLCGPHSRFAHPEGVPHRGR
jgi:hypothetical protein